MTTIQEDKQMTEETWEQFVERMKEKYGEHQAIVGLGLNSFLEALGTAVAAHDRVGVNGIRRIVNGLLDAADEALDRQDGTPPC